jgi:hypothetical protein
MSRAGTAAVTAGDTATSTTAIVITHADGSTDLCPPVMHGTAVDDSIASAPVR